MEIRTILLAVDLSEASRVAALHAIGLARQLGARLVMLHVDEIGAPSGELSPALTEYMAKVNDARTRWMTRLETTCAECNVTAELAQVVAEPDEGILDYVANHEVDLVVMGRSGAGAYRRFMTGSTVKRVLHHLELPMLVVPFDGDESHAPTGPVEYRKLLTTTDFSPASDAGLRVSVALAERLRATLTVLHVERAPLVGVLPEEPVQTPTEHLELLRQEVDARLHTSMAELGIADDDRITPAATVATSVPRAIVEASVELDTDMIVIPNQGKGRLKRLLIGSTTERVLSSTEQPLLVLPRAWLERDTD